VHFRIFLEARPLARILLPFILERRSTYGNDAAPGLRSDKLPSVGRKKLLVEFSSPNITNEFQGKHLRSTIIGAFVSRFHENMGWDVTRINYLGDWGKDTALLKVGWAKFGNEAEYEANPIGYLLEVFHQISELFQPEKSASKQARDQAAKDGHDEGEAQAEIENQGIFAERNAAFKKLEEGDEEAVAFWKRVRDVNIENYQDFYSKLGVKFDEYTGESQVTAHAMAEVEHMLKEKGICTESAGAWVVHMQDIGLKAGTGIIRDRTGATTYLLRDLAAVLERSRKYEFDKMIIVAANDNGVHFTHVHHILKALGMADLADKVTHLRFNEQSKMGEKLGKGYRPQAIIAYCEDAMKVALETDQEKTAMFKGPVEGGKALGIAALLAQELSTRTASAHAFDTSAMTAFKSGTGPDLQYWYTKLCSILKDHPSNIELADEDYAAFVADEPANLLRILAQYPEVTHAAYQSLESAVITMYLASVVELLADCLSEDEEEDREEAESPGDADAEATKPKDDAAIGTDEAAKEPKILTPGHLLLFEATRVVLENGMKLLGIVPYATTEPDRADTPIAE
jgi:arginyl-tRNA synthetase